MLKSNMFSIEWPPKSGRQREFPEVDKAAWVDVETARRKILKGQAPFLDQLLVKLRMASDTVMEPSRLSGYAVLVQDYRDDFAGIVLTKLIWASTIFKKNSVSFSAKASTRGWFVA